MTGCKGQCCRNPFGVCAHARKCDHHAPEIAEEARLEQAWEWEQQILAQERNRS